MSNHEINLGQLAQAINEPAKTIGGVSGASGPVAYAPPAIRRVHEEEDVEQGNGRPPQLEWPLSEVERPVLPKAPETPPIVHEAATDLAHVFEACAVEIERASEELKAQTAQVIEDAAYAAKEIRGIKDRAVISLQEQTVRARKASAYIHGMVKKLKEGKPLEPTEAAP